jgi:hypothetical protein
MTTTSLATDSADAARSLAYLGRLGLAPDQVAEKVAELRPAVEAGDGAAMLAALDQARAWWDGYDVAWRFMGDDELKQPFHLTHGWADLMELVARAPAPSLAAVLAKARLADWTKGDGHGDAPWDAELLRTLHEGVAALAAAEATGGARDHV